MRSSLFLIIYHIFLYFKSDLIQHSTTGIIIPYIYELLNSAPSTTSNIHGSLHNRHRIHLCPRIRCLGEIKYLGAATAHRQPKRTKNYSEDTENMIKQFLVAEEARIHSVKRVVVFILVFNLLLQARLPTPGSEHLLLAKY